MTPTIGKVGTSLLSGKVVSRKVSIPLTHPKRDTYSTAPRLIEAERNESGNRPVIENGTDRLQFKYTMDVSNTRNSGEEATKVIGETDRESPPYPSYEDDPDPIDVTAGNKEVKAHKRTLQSTSMC